MKSKVKTFNRNIQSGGVVIYINDQADSYGNHIMISHGNDVYTLYAHNSQLLVSVGDTVKQGQQIAVFRQHR